MTFVDNVERHRYEMFVDEELAGVEVYRLSGNDLILVHTEIFEQFAGRHFASALATHVLDDARRRGLNIIPECPYIRHFISEHQAQYLDLVPVDRRVEFDLPTSVE